MATAMVALIFGLARMLLDKQISSFVIFIAAVAADLGLLVLIAQKKSDLLRILRVIALLIFGISLIATVVCCTRFFFIPLSSLPFLLICSVVSVGMFFLCRVLDNKINELSEKEQQQNNVRDEESQAIMVNIREDHTNAEYPKK
jgi:hypothetical protein